MTKVSFAVVVIIILLTSCNQQSNDIRYSRNVRELSSISITPILYNKPLFTEDIQAVVNETYGFKTIIINNISTLPTSFFNRQKGIHYSADSIIAYLANRKSNSTALTIGYTPADIYITKRDKQGNIKEPRHKYEIWGIFGLAKCPGRSSVVSTKRLYSPDINTFRQRVLKVMLHEIGHNLGLKHCDNKTCFMTDAVENISSIDNSSLDLCNKCSAQINN